MDLQKECRSKAMFFSYTEKLFKPYQLDVLCDPDFLYYRCDTPATPCLPDPCRNGTCEAFGTVHFECTCDYGFSGLHCDNNIGKLLM